MSILEEAVASSYAGDSLQFAIKRGNEDLSFAVTLAEELPAANPGYIGLLTTRIARRHRKAQCQTRPLSQNSCRIFRPNKSRRLKKN